MYSPSSPNYAIKYNAKPNSADTSLQQASSQPSHEH